MSARRLRAPALAALLLAGTAAGALAAPVHAPGSVPASSARTASITLARDGRTRYTIVTTATEDGPERLAAGELARYLERITGARFPIAASAAGRAPIVLRVARDSGSGEEGYTIAVRGDTLLLTGGSGRAVLYAAYDLLARLGCQWLAPQLDFYEGAAEVVPRAPTLVYAPAGDVVERPAFAIRKLDVEEGLSHDTESLRRIVAWMPKLRYNTLQVPMDYQGRGRVRWDAWREALTPELDRRGLLIEVGGHGYQNYLNADMEGGRLFAEHPDWFGQDAQCRPSRAEHLVFNTESPDAVRYVIDNVIRYLRAHPEIDIFDFWPPDGARWAECEDWAAFGTPEDRQAKLVNQVAAALREAGIPTRLEIIAYAHAKLPPQTVALDPSVLVDFCPIGQNFHVQIDDPAGHNNAIYVDAIHHWRQRFRGDIGLYSYYRKYAWRSRPVVIPHYLQHDFQWYAGVPLQAASTYAEPGDWYTYEVNHYLFGQLAWNPWVDVDALLDRMTRARYGGAWQAARAALVTLEDVVRVYGAIPYSPSQPADGIAAALRRVEERAAALDGVRLADPVLAANLDRLRLMLGFARRDLALQRLRAGGADPATVRAGVEELVAFLQADADRGVFLMRGEGDLGRYLTQYGVRAGQE
ncbi:MAG TPA: DUF4838 domain-containing protein [Gemmatimonadaceae bacterium]|nr:DUF4838 domain-containing protein [Gemmatimonadaceae bacterium]